MCRRRSIGNFDPGAIINGGSIFCGSIVGWIYLWNLGLKFVPLAVTDTYPLLKWDDIGLAFIAFLGVTGNLLATVITVVNTGLSVIGKITGGGEE